MSDKKQERARKKAERAAKEKEAQEAWDSMSDGAKKGCLGTAAFAMLAVVVLFVISAGGGGDSTPPAESPTESAPVESNEPDVDDELASEREDEILRVLKALDPDRTWGVKSVEVSGTSVRIKTDLWPKTENNDAFTGVCATAWSEAEDWAKFVNVFDVHDGIAADWMSGRYSCHLYNR